MATNDGWPEAFGFSVVGGKPVTIGSVEEGGSAQQAGLQTGDIIAELDGDNVREYSVDELIERARAASKVPPSMLVISRIRSLEISRSKEGGFGVTLRGDAPVFIRTVDFRSSAWHAGLRSGDLILEVNGHEVRHSTKQEILELLKSARSVLRLVVVVGGSHATSVQYSVNSGKRIEKKYQRSKAFRDKVNYYLMDDLGKREQLFALLRLYTKDRDVDSLVSSLGILLDTAIERRLLGDLRSFIDPTQVARFDALVSKGGHRKGSLPSQFSQGSPQYTSSPRLVKIDRGNGEFGFNLSGNAPVFIRSIDPASPAMSAKLKAGDHILEINGHDVRSATHSQVVQLLKASGARPSLLVAGSTGSRRASLVSTTSSQRSSSSRGTRLQSTAFKEKMEAALLADEKQAVLQQLTQYSQNRDLNGLVGGLADILNDPKKASIFHYICQLLPEEVQREFDRLAAMSISHGQSGGLRPHPMANSGDQSDDVMFLAQVGRLPHEDVHTSRHIASAQIGREGRGGAGPIARGGTGAAAHLELQDTVIRSTARESTEDELQFEYREAKRENAATTSVGPSAKSVPQGQPPTRIKSPKDGASVDSTTSIASLHEATGPPPPPPPPPPPFVPMFGPDGVPIPPPPPFVPMFGPDGVPIPPPPPPSTSSQHQTSSNLKRVNWDKLSSTEGTIWRELSGLEEALEYCEIETKFSNQKPKDTKGSKLQQNQTILDSKKAYNLSILLGHLKLPVEQIKQAVLSCDSSLLSEQHWRQMEAFAPDQRECASYAQHGGSTSTMGVADKFSCEMSTIPFYRERLQSIIFKMYFKEKVDEIKPDLEGIIEASLQLQSSKHLKRILEIVLAIGNYMNAGHKRVGSAQGFRISFLTQLKSLRTSDNKSSLLHFLTATVERKFPPALNFHNDIPAVSKAARVSGQTLEDEIADLSEKLDVTQRAVSAVRASVEDRLPEDRFEEVMSTFVSEAEEEMTKLVRLHQQMKHEYQRAARFFGEDPSKIRIDEFYGAFAGFVTDFGAALKEIRSAREQELQKEKRMKEQEERSKRRTFRLSTSQILTPLKHQPEEPKNDTKLFLDAERKTTTEPEMCSDKEQLKWQSGGSYNASNDSIGDLGEQGRLPLQDQLAKSGLEFDGETDF